MVHIIQCLSKSRQVQWDFPASAAFAVGQETCAEGKANMPPWPGICMPTGTPPIIPANCKGHWAMGPCIKRNNNQLILKGLEFHEDISRVYIYIGINTHITYVCNNYFRLSRKWLWGGSRKFSEKQIMIKFFKHRPSGSWYALCPQFS